MKADEKILQLPQPIVERLREVIRGIRRLQWIKGSLWTLAAAVGCAGVVMGVDALFSLETPGVRLAISLGGLGLVLLVAWRVWFRPLSRRISLTAVARWVETRHPEMQERISTAVELLDARHGSRDSGSRELLEAVVQEALADVSRMDPVQELGKKRARPAQWGAGVAVGGLILLAVLWPQQIPRLLGRALRPLSDTGNAWAGGLRWLTESQVVGVGGDIILTVAAKDIRERVEFHLQAEDGSVSVEIPASDPGVATTPGEKGFFLRMPGLKESFTARVVAGAAVSAPVRITVLPVPAAGPLTVHYDYPEYCGKPDETVMEASGEIAALTGTRVTVRAPLNRPVTRSSVRMGELDVPDVRLEKEGEVSTVVWSLVLAPNLNSTWSYRLEDEHGLVNHPGERTIRSLPDLPPVIALETPVEDRMELRPVEKLPLTYSVQEDIGLSTVQIRVRTANGPERLLAAGSMPLPQEGQPGRFRGVAVLDLASLTLPENGEIRVALQAADRLPSDQQGPQTSISREITIKLNRWTRALVEKNFEDQHRELMQGMEDAKRELQNARGRLQDKPDRLNRESTLGENTLKDLEQSNDHMQAAQDQLQKLAARMQQTAYARQNPAMEQIAREMVAPAREQAAGIPLTDERGERSAMAQKAKDLLKEAIQQLEQEQRQMDQDRQAVQQVAKLSDLAEQQQTLAREAAAALQPAALPPSSAGPENPLPSGKDSASPPASAAAPESAHADPAAGPSEEDQKKWLEEQRRVAERARELDQQNRNSNPQALQQQMMAAASQANQLAAEAAQLSASESKFAESLQPSPSSPEAEQQAAAQQELVNRIEALGQKATSFQESSRKTLDQSTESQKAASTAQAELDTAARAALTSAQTLTAFSKSQPRTPQTAPAPASTPASTPAAGAASTPEAPPASSEAAEAAPAPGSGQTGAPAQTAAASPGPGGGSGQEKEAVSSPPAQQPARQSAASLKKAAAEWDALSRELNSLAGMVEGHQESLSMGAQQAGTATDQANQARQQESSKNQGMQQGAEAAAEAARQLSMAASTAMQTMSIPAEAKSSAGQSKGSKGQGKPTPGAPQEGAPGQEGKGGMQADLANAALPPELARLGLSADDWMKLRSSLEGVDASRSEQIPAEYRDLVKAYFGALSKGTP